MISNFSLFYPGVPQEPNHLHPHGEAHHLINPTDQSIWQICEAKPELGQLAALSSAEAVCFLLLSTTTDKDRLAGVVRDTWRKLVE